jgi:sigma-B regulation protein RsbU (phosphoserine phosphatase)
LATHDSRARDALLEESAEDLYENAPCGFLSTLPDGTVVKVNDTLLEWTGHSREGIVGRRFADLLGAGGRIYHETHYAPMLQMQGAVREVALEIVRADGSRMPVLVNSTLRKDADGAAIGIRTVIFEATVRREYEQELLRARKQEQQARERAELFERTMARLAEENAALYERERDVARTLQTSLLAGEPPSDERYSVATFYSPAIDTLEVGGDWHDAIAFDEDRVAISVGDVVGRGIDAATTMGQLRSAIRALACTGLSPSRLLDHLDTYVGLVGRAWMSTLAYADVDLARGRMSYACAGHLPPLLVEPGEPPRLLWDGRSPPLSAHPNEPIRPEDAVTLRRGSRVLLYTDGLVERRDRSIDDGLTHLLEEVGARRDASPAELVEKLPPVMLAGATGEDDVCLLAFAFEGG